MSKKPTYKGDLAGFPAEVVEKMLERQFEQTGKRDVSVFEANRTSDKQKNGFDWGNTTEDFDFWNEVIGNKNFDLFFKRYPKTEAKPDLHKQIAALQARIDVAVKALDELMNSMPENMPLYKDSGLWQLRSDDMEDVLFQQEVNECFIDFVKRITKLKGGSDDNR